MSFKFFLFIFLEVIWMNMLEKAEKIQKAFREAEELSIELAQDIMKDKADTVHEWEYLQERREKHLLEHRRGFNEAYGAINALINIDGLGSVDVKKRGHIND